MIRNHFRLAFSSLIFCAAIAAAAPLVSVGQKTYITTSAKLWTEPNRFGEAVAQLKAGLPVDVLDYDASRGWILVRTPSGREGWLPLRFTSQDSRRTQPMISHKPNHDDSRSPAGFEDTVDQDSAAGAANAAPVAAKPGAPVDIAVGYANQLNVDRASGVDLGVDFNFNIDPNLRWGVGLGYKLNLNAPQGLCGGDLCEVNRKSHRIYPHVQIEFVKDNFTLGANLGFVIEHTGITTTNLTTGTIVQTDQNGYPATASDTDYRLGVGVRAGYGFHVSAASTLGPYVSYDADIAFTNKVKLSGLPASKFFSYFSGGALFQTAF